MSQWTLGFVGSGVMAGVMIDGLVHEGLLPPERILASDPRQSRLQEIEHLIGTGLFVGDAVFDPQRAIGVHQDKVGRAAANLQADRQNAARGQTHGHRRLADLSANRSTFFQDPIALKLPKNHADGLR